MLLLIVIVLDVDIKLTGLIIFLNSTPVRTYILFTNLDTFPNKNAVH